MALEISEVCLDFCVQALLLDVLLYCSVVCFARKYRSTLIIGLLWQVVFAYPNFKSRCYLFKKLLVSVHK